MTSLIKLTKVIPEILNHQRLDIALSALLPEFSRARIQEWIRIGWVTVDAKKLRPRDKVVTHQTVIVNATVDAIIPFQPQQITLDVLYIDRDIILINKPVGLVMHPGAGNINNTLLNALLYHYPELAIIPRAGIIHRLDKDTSGIIVVARNLQSYNKLIDALQRRTINREYEAIVNGVMLAGGVITASLGRHPVKRTCMAVKINGKNAVTHYRIIHKFSNHTHIRVFLETGRTHQIRVHMAYIGYPIIGDQSYNLSNKITNKISPVLHRQLEGFKHQALHARKLKFFHPATGKLVVQEAPYPQDFKDLLQTLINYN
ncbi:MAG: 23S rRNA pseudouridine(1911/1915/1917) synthase RluD [Coxiellaceae bacterium]|jgi:23S rRNA pseudouridine1911/1915/1917 synthase|nr:23S rRNA pseudouridine(1911/1915/1917) synthase RluD [Coxiellaceae bacterium]